MKSIRFVIFAILAIVVGLAVASPTGGNLPTDPDDLDTVACNGVGPYACLYLVNAQIDEPVFHNEQLAASGTKRNGDRLYVLNGGKGTITGRCLGGAAQSQIRFDYNYPELNPDGHSRAYFDHGVINAQFRTNWDNVLSAQNRYIESDKKSDLRIYCSRT